uniref:E3 ubiquitin-protein ligase TRIM7-like n=1 Tax=Podarcis muralis TaxID=64176 RepID=UPI00109FA74E|nr:E3 ubiquitin-protein ligase TRIM7-like [Podarcis muralis]
MAASGGPVRDLCEEATCSICLEYFRDPVIIPECGHNFCRACLTQCWEKSEGEASCPQCRERVEQSSIRRNQQLANFVEIIKKFNHPQGEEKEKEGSVRKDQESPARAFVQSDTSSVVTRALRILAEKLGLQEEKQEEGKRRVCEKHQEPLKLFCKEDQSPICVVCDRSKEHKSHEVVPLEEASQEYKDQISSCLDNVRKEREKILVFKANTEKESQDLLKQTGAEKEKMVAEFRRLHQFLEEQEKRILAQMAEVEKEIAAQREEHLARLSRELSSLDSLIREMKEKLQEPESELLQDIGSFVQRSQEKENLEDPPVAFPPALKWKIWDFRDINPFLKGVMKKLRDTVEYGLQLRKENVTLDPDTANPYLILSEDGKSVSWGEVRQDLPDNPERFDRYTYVLGCEVFTAGRHFWEVIVGREEHWGVGVAIKSVKRKGKFSFGPTDGIWGLRKWGGGYTPLEAPVPSEEPKRIRVTLNCEGGRVSFYDADTAVLLYTFPATSFSGETLQPFFYISRKAKLRLS